MGESRESYCATPQFALQTSSEQLQSLVERLRLAGKASLFCEAVESNQCQPCSFFQTSSGKVTDRIAASNVEQQRGEEQWLYIHALYEHVPTYKHGDCVVDSVTAQKINDKVGVSIDRSIEVCLQTINQSTEPSWYLECSNRITASIFGKVLNRRQSIQPSSLVKSITDRSTKGGTSMPAALRWGIEHEDIAIQQYSETNMHIVKKCGFVISPTWPWLGCSPDGIIFENDIPVGCLEIKCPYSKRDMKLEEASSNDKNFFLNMA